MQVRRYRQVMESMMQHDTLISQHLQLHARQQARPARVAAVKCQRTPCRKLQLPAGLLTANAKALVEGA